VRPARATCSPYSGSRSLRLQTIFHCATSCLMIVCSCCVDMSSLSNTCRHRYFQMFHVVYRTCCTLSLALGSCALIMLFHQALNPVRFSSMFVTLAIRAWHTGTESSCGLRSLGGCGRASILGWLGRHVWQYGLPSIICFAV
jgi:hypothetical protein